MDNLCKIAEGENCAQKDYAIGGGGIRHEASCGHFIAVVVRQSELGAVPVVFVQGLTGARRQSA